jgi:hypothetical protein
MNIAWMRVTIYQYAAQARRKSQSLSGFSSRQGAFILIGLICILQVAVRFGVESGKMHPQQLRTTRTMSLRPCQSTVMTFLQ